MPPDETDIDHLRGEQTLVIIGLRQTVGDRTRKRERKGERKKKKQREKERDRERKRQRQRQRESSGAL